MPCLVTIKNCLVEWSADESGNAGVDWVVLLAGIASMTLVVMLSISGGVNTFGDQAEDQLANNIQVGGNF